ncbi:MAG: hypothetical protein IJD80_01655, partial [Oscillospiraceae bacterium]|nr:hypothetical protein [Oscillospiraceae bacterium]
MKLIKVIIAAALSAALLMGCTEEKPPEYDLNIISPSFVEAYNHYKSEQSENVRYEKCLAQNYSDLINEETLPQIKSITVVDDSITTETAQEITDLCKEENIPVFFFMSNIDKQVLDSYDKVYCLT